MQCHHSVSPSSQLNSSALCLWKNECFILGFSGRLLLLLVFEAQEWSVRITAVILERLQVGSTFLSRCLAMSEEASLREEAHLRATAARLRSSHGNSGAWWRLKLHQLALRGGRLLGHLKTRSEELRQTQMGSRGGAGKGEGAIKPWVRPCPPHLAEEDPKLHLLRRRGVFVGRSLRQNLKKDVNIQSRGTVKRLPEVEQKEGKDMASTIYSIYSL